MKINVIKAFLGVLQCCWENIICSFFPARHTRNFPATTSCKIVVVCHRNNHYDTLTFQILPDDIMANKPALLSGGDSERLGLVRIEYDTVFSLSPSSNNCHLQHSRAQEQVECNHNKQLHNNGPSTSNPLLSGDYLPQVHFRKNTF